MYKTLVLTGVLLAQAAVPIRPVPPPPMRPLPAAYPADGITVSGSGIATAQATDAVVTLRMSSRNNAMILTRQSLQPVVDALVRAGADASTVVLPPYMVGNARTNNAYITAQVHHPTTAMLQQGMLTLANLFASQPDVILNGADVRLRNSDCSALQRSAEALAIANAKANAAFLAKEIGAQAGSILAIEERTPMMLPDGCGQTYSIGPYGPPQMPADDMLTVKVYSNVGMRFAIKH